MKNLLIMRHAKSDWGNPSLSDFERPLNERGLKSAPLMGNELVKRNKIPDLIISSPANRAKSTAIIVAKACSYANTIIYEQDFYFGSLDEIIKIIQKNGSQYPTIMVIGHNPTWESMAYKFLKTSKHIQMPTAAILSIQFDFDNWNNLKAKSGDMEWMVIPKELNG